VGAAWRHGVRHPLELVRPLEGPGTARLEEARLSLGPWVGGTGSGTARPAALLTVWAAGRPWGAAPVAVGPPLG
jgi:hypothetical protein